MPRKLSSHSDQVGTGMIDATALAKYIERISSLMQEQKSLTEEIKEVCGECDDAGVATKREIRRLARESLMEQDVLQAQLERMDVLRHALGQLAGTPLGEAAEKEVVSVPRVASWRRLDVEEQAANG